MIRMLTLFAALSFSSLVAAFPLPRPGQSMPPHAMSGQYNYEGIVRISNCSGSLVRFEQSLEDDPAMVLTNGHCLESGFPRPGEIVFGRASRQRFTLLNAYGDSNGTVRATMVMYATMTGTDMALYRLGETYRQISAKSKVSPLTLAAQRPQSGTEIEVISGYWITGFSCAIEDFVFQLREGSYTMHDSLRYTRPGCEVYGGTSGSPVIDRLTRQVVGVNNTGNESGGRCTMNNPCEIDQKGDVQYQRGLSYGQQTYWIYSCLNAQRELDLNLAGCLLPH